MDPHLFKPSPQESKTFWERKYWDQQIPWIAGLDEAGRGAWAGPVVAAAVIFKPYTELPSIDDSKKVSPGKREILFDLILETAVVYHIGIIDSDKIDEVNILEASVLAMQEAVGGLSIAPSFLLIDGNRGIGLPIPQKVLVKGDARSMTIGAASILAKVSRDRLMAKLESSYPLFQFSRHKGYGTKVHQAELAKHGPTPIHRFSFEPVRLCKCKN